MKKVLFILVFAMTFIVSTTSADEGGVAPFSGAFNYCVDKGTSIADARDRCETIWYVFCGWEVEAPVTVTHCPNSNSDNNGKKDDFTPNGFCDLECPEGMVELNCMVKSEEPCDF